MEAPHQPRVSIRPIEVGGRYFGVTNDTIGKVVEVTKVTPINVQFKFTRTAHGAGRLVQGKKFMLEHQAFRHTYAPCDPSSATPAPEPPPEEETVSATATPEPEPVQQQSFERPVHSRLTWVQEWEIAQFSLFGGQAGIEAAAAYGVSPSTVSRIRTRYQGWTEAELAGAIAGAQSTTPIAETPDLPAADQTEETSVPEPAEQPTKRNDVIEMFAADAEREQLCLYLAEGAQTLDGLIGEVTEAKNLLVTFHGRPLPSWINLDGIRDLAARLKALRAS